MKLIYFCFSILLICSFLFSSCDMSANMQPKGNYISGHLNFVDTNFVKTGGHYAVALYSNQNSYYSTNPIITKEVNPDVSNECSYYRIYWDGEGSCIVSAVWISDSNKTVPLVLGVFGCDTTKTCSSPHLVGFPNYTGADYFFSCWADTTKRFN